MVDRPTPAVGIHPLTARILAATSRGQLSVTDRNRASIQVTTRRGPPSAGTGITEPLLGGHRQRRHPAFREALHCPPARGGQGSPDLLRVLLASAFRRCAGGNGGGAGGRQDPTRTIDDHGLGRSGARIQTEDDVSAASAMGSRCCSPGHPSRMARASSTAGVGMHDGDHGPGHGCGVVALEDVAAHGHPGGAGVDPRPGCSPAWRPRNPWIPPGSPRVRTSMR